MEIFVTEIKNQLARLKKIAANNMTGTAWSGILLEGNRLVASNHELTVTTTLDCDDSDEVMILPINAVDVICSMPNEKLTLTPMQKEGAFAVDIRCGKIHGLYSTTDPATFVRTTDKEYDKRISFDGERFVEGLRRIRFAMAKDNLQKMMAACCLKTKPGGKELEIVALNGTTVARDAVAVKGDELETIIPRDTVMYMIDLGLNADTRLYVGENHASFRSGDYEVVSRIVDGKYYDFRRLMDADEFHIHTDITAKAFIDAMKRASLSVKDKKPAIFNFKSTEVEFTMTSSVGKYAESIQHLGDISEELRIAFDPVILTNALSSCSGDTAEIFLRGASQPVIIRDNTTDFKALVLPVRVA